MFGQACTYLDSFRSSEVNDWANLAVAPKFKMFVFREIQTYDLTKDKHVFVFFMSIWPNPLELGVLGLLELLMTDIGLEILIQQSRPPCHFCFLRLWLQIRQTKCHSIGDQSHQSQGSRSKLKKKEKYTASLQAVYAAKSKKYVLLVQICWRILTRKRKRISSIRISCKSGLSITIEMDVQLIFCKPGLSIIEMDG